MPRVRTTVASLAAATLLLGAAAPAAAQTTAVSAAEAGSAGLTLTVAGTEVLTVAETAAAAIPGEAAALGNPLAIGGTPIGALSAESDGDAVAEDGCASPEVPAPLNSLVDVALACADVAADGDARSASATAGVAEVGVLQFDGADLDLLDGLLDTLPLDDLLGTLEDSLLAQIGGVDGPFGDVREQCVDALDDLPLVGDLLAGLAAASPDAIGPLLDTIEGLLGSLFPTVCDVLGEVADLVTGDGDLVGTITEGDLLGALDDTEGLLSVTVLETTSEVDRDGDTITAAAGPGDAGTIAITLDLPLLGDAIGELLVGALTPVTEALDTILEPLNDAITDIPVLGEIVAPLLDSGDLGAVLDGPLLEVGIAPGSSSATGDLGDQSTSGSADPALVVLDGSLLNLPILSGLDEALNEAVNVIDTEVLSVLRDSPLVDLLDVELLPGDVDEDADVQGLPGTRATSGTASVSVLSIIGDPLLDLQLAPAVAAVGVADITPAGPDPDDEDPATPVTPAGPDARPLPVTGAGAALFGLLALGAAGALRRRD